MDMGMLPRKHLHVKHVLQTVCALEAVILRSFGPGGGQVLFTRDTAEAMLTRSGIRILTSLRLENPLARMVVECVWKHSTVTGDGSKTFILLLASLLRMIHTTACKEPNMSHTYNSREAAEAAAARHLAEELLAFALKELMMSLTWEWCLMDIMFPGRTLLQNPHQPLSQTITFPKLLSSFYHTRLGDTHCSFTSSLTCELLTNCTFKNDLSFSSLQFIKDNFPALHTPISGYPINCSRLIEGQVIHRDFATPCLQIHRLPVKAVVFTGYLQSRFLSAGHVLELGLGEQEMEENSGKKKSIVQFSSWSERSLECNIAKLHSLGVSVLLSGVKQSAAALALAAQADICVVECVSEDELSLFTQLAGTTPVSDCWMIEPRHVASLRFCQPVLLGANSYVHVAFDDSEKRAMVKPCSLVICGSGEGQTDQYACAFRDAIYLLLTTLQPTGTTAITASKMNLQPHESLPASAPSFQQCVLEPGCVLPAGGTFEILLHQALLQHGNSLSACDSTNMGIPTVLQLLAKALLSVPQRIYSHSPRHFLQFQTRVLSSSLSNQERKASPAQGCGASNSSTEDDKQIKSVHCCGKADMSSNVFMLDCGLESVSCKYQLLLAVVQCLADLLRVDTLLHSHTALRTQTD
ncbi:hypothetical protein Q5P01_012420 [Channa striata]|uniref:Bardet-Biedl syndrome 10 protein n=1 Tax=Channa striata TaxID=64152 RepID=A0AA88MPU6_CHASR|nr:hypothetical protein Q5P01_012420 [Channa striata]